MLWVLRVATVVIERRVGRQAADSKVEAVERSFENIFLPVFFGVALALALILTQPMVKKGNDGIFQNLLSNWPRSTRIHGAQAISMVERLGESQVIGGRRASAFGH